MRTDVYAELVAALVASAIMLRSIDRRGWDAIDFGRAAARWRLLAAGFLTGALPITLTCGVLAAVGWFGFVTTPSNSSWLAAAFRISLVLVPAALAEELISRGYLLTVIREAAGVRAAVVGTSVMFGTLHVFNPSATPLSVTVVTLSGLLLATVRLRFASLHAAWMTHLAWNWVMAVLLHAPVSGLAFEAPGYKGVTSGPSWVSGGGWGPEGGAVAALALLGTLGFFYMRRRREES